MLSRLNTLIIACSNTWWKFMLVVAGTFGTMGGLMAITGGFPAIAGGAEPFDMQNTLQFEEVFVQLAAYSDEAFIQYSWFQAIDYLFPLVAGLMLAALCAFSLRHISRDLYARIKSAKLFPLLLLPTLFDWLENINLLIVVSSWPERAETAATLALLAKAAKLGTLNAVWGITGLLLTTALLVTLARYLRPSN